MACKILVGKTDGVERACFYDPSTERVFGFLLKNLEEAESFQKWVLKKDNINLEEISYNSRKFKTLLAEFRGDHS